MEFKSFGKIEQAGKMCMSITQKIHGTNAQIYIFKNENGELNLLTGSRTRWITPDDDNFGFAKFVNERKEKFIEFLGEGRHFGEWAGPGINSGEGLTEKTLFLFNWKRWKDNAGLMALGVKTVPLLYLGNLDLSQVDFAMDLLKNTGSKAVFGFKNPEGIVIEICGNFYKKVFTAEESAWGNNGIKPRRERAPLVDVEHLLQPIRLEKLLSRDECYLREYPESLPSICKDYMDDLTTEQPLNGTEDEIKVIKKELGRSLFRFVKENIKLCSICF